MFAAQGLEGNEFFCLSMAGRLCNARNAWSLKNYDITVRKQNSPGCVFLNLFFLHAIYTFDYAA
jgi:hypothetical protein